MSAKKLDQSVFDGLPKEYRWAAVDADGEAHLYNRAPELSVANDVFGYFANFAKGDDYLDLGEGYDARDWQNSLIERQDVPKADIDWSKAPKGATHYSKRFGDYYKAEDGFLLNYLADESRWIVLIDWSISALESPHFEMIKRPESITDVARSIEAARLAEKSCNRCATCTANICSVIDDCYVQRAKEESARIEEQACMPYPDGDPRYFETSDVVNNPAHYTTGGIECIDAMQAMLSREEFIGYLRGNIFKYQWRYKHKNGVEDLRKADWYAQRLIKVEGEK